MYEFLQGEIASISPTRVSLDVGGIGYAVEIPLSTFEALPRAGTARLWVHLHVREDALRFFGFATLPERRLFRLLLTVSGIGPGVAINLLSRATVADIRDAIASERIDLLTAIKGVGKKTAQRLVTEIKDRIADVGAVASSPRDDATSDLEHDAIQALQVLGYSPKVARKAVEAARGAHPGATVETVIRAALKKV